MIYYTIKMKFLLTLNFRMEQQIHILLLLFQENRVVDLGKKRKNKTNKLTNKTHHVPATLLMFLPKLFYVMFH